MSLTDRIDVVGQRVYDILVENQAALGLEDVWYGDQALTPRTPSAVVETGPKRRELNGVPRRFEVNFDIYVMLYLERIQDTQLNRKQSETLAEDVEAVLHADETLGGIVISSWVGMSEPGYAQRGRELVSAVRLTFQGKSQKHLPSAAYPNP